MRPTMLRKKIVYILLFTIFGIILSTIIHGVVEIFYIDLLVSDFDKFGLGLTWGDWYLIHIIFGSTLFIIGVIFGFLQGEYWWKKLYEEGYISKAKKLFKKILRR